VDQLQDDIEGIKENATYLEETIIESVRDEITDANNLINTNYTDIIQLKGDVLLLK
jgi:hypothetical protein